MFEQKPHCRPVPRWVHAWAILTAVCTTPLLALGGLVTTRRVGMADPVWPTTPWYLFFASWQEPRPGFLIEHAHRFAGYLVGFLVIVLAIAMWRTARTRGLRWLGVVCLIAVSLQGMLGGFRVVLNELVGTDLAAVHGVCAQIVFCILIGAAYFTARPAQEAELPDEARRKLQGIATILVLLVLMQLVWGSLVRHNPTALMQRLHLFTAFAVVAAAVWLILSAQSLAPTSRRLRWSNSLLGLFLVLQVVLGIEAWMGKFASGILWDLQTPTTGQIIARTAHVLVGAGIFAMSVVLMLQTREVKPLREFETPKSDESQANRDLALVGSGELRGTS